MKKILILFLALCSSLGTVYSDITWSAPSAISTALTDASDPRVVIDSGNNATAIWIENGDIMASSLPSGGSWSTPVAISNTANTSTDPTLGVDSSGNVTALWIENTLVTSATLPFGGSWGTAVTVSGSGATTPSLAVAPSGTAVAVWTRSGFIESSTRISGAWSLVAVLSTSNSNNPHVAISSFGTAHAVWHSLSSGSDIIVTNILTISSNTWGTNRNVFQASAAMKHNYPKIAVDNSGNAVVAWFRYNFLNNAYQNVQTLTASLSQGATTWATTILSPLSGLRNPADLTIKIRFDPTGNALIVWTMSYDGEIFTVESAQKLFGSTWPIPATPQTPSLYTIGMDVGITSGTAALVNMWWDGISSIQIISQETNTTNPVFQAWTVMNAVSTGDDNAYPRCALSTTGSTINAIAVWVHFDGANNVINASTGTDTVIDPPSNVSASQSLIDFEVYQDYSNTITWDASSDPNVIQYNVYRNGIYFAATDPGTLEFVDHNAIQNGTVTYGVSALTSSFRVSDIITFTLFP